MRVGAQLPDEDVLIFVEWTSAGWDQSDLCGRAQRELPVLLWLGCLLASRGHSLSQMEQSRAGWTAGGQR